MSRTLGSFTPRRIAQATGTPGAYPRRQATFTSTSLIVPAGWGQYWYPYRQTRGTARGEFIGFGDSTMWGSGGLYSWLQRIRDRAVTYGMADGGKGMFSVGEDQTLYDPPEINGFVSNNYGGFADAYDVLGGGDWFDDGSTPGHQLTLQFRSSAARLWYEERGDAGDFLYSVDGGAAQTVHATGQGGSKFVYLSGYDPTATHTVTVTNKGGRDALPPAGVTAGANSPSSGTIPAGTYYYVATYVFGGGETLPSTPVSVTTAGTRSIGVTVAKVGQDSINIYRGTSSSGPFQYVTSTSSGGTSTAAIFTDDGSITPTAQTPPSTGTTNLNTNAPHVYATLAPMNDTGFTVQKFARSGQTANIFNTIWHYWPEMGLTYNGTGDKTSTASYAIDVSYNAAARVRPVAAVWQLGFNDLSTQANTDFSTYTKAIQTFAALCQVAGCDGIVASGQLPYNANWPTYGAALFAAMRDTAVSLGLAWIDLFTPVGGPSLSYSAGTSNPHLTKTQYQAQADYIWDNLLGI